MRVAGPAWQGHGPDPGLSVNKLRNFFIRTSGLAMVALELAACGGANDVQEAAEAGAARLMLSIDTAQTGSGDRHCTFGGTVRNDTGAAALNVQVAWMAETDGFGFISDYQMLGDFAAGEARPLQLAVAGAPCNAVRNLTLTRAACVVGPAQDPPQSCAEAVMLDGGTVVAISR